MCHTIQLHAHSLSYLFVQGTHSTDHNAFQFTVSKAYFRLEMGGLILNTKQSVAICNCVLNCHKVIYIHPKYDSMSQKHPQQQNALCYGIYYYNTYCRFFHVLAKPTCKVWHRPSHIFMCVLQPNMYISKDHQDDVVCNQIY